MKKRTKISLIVLIIVAIVCFGGAYLSVNGILQMPSLKQHAAESQNSSKQFEEDKEEDSSNNSESSSKEESNANLIFTGDIELTQTVQSHYDSSGIDGVIEPELRQYFTSADFVGINNEFCFSTRGQQMKDKQYTFRVNPQYVSVLKDLNVSLAGLANNHVLDYGKKALSDTFTTLDDADIKYTGAGKSLSDASKLVTYEKDGVTYGFLASSHIIPVANWDVKNSQPGVFTFYDPTDLYADIKVAKKECDVVVVFVHWGTEHTDVLTDYQTTMAHGMVDAGADIIIGAHPHVVQGIEKYNDGMIFYSLGNFIFDHDISRTFALSVTKVGSKSGTSGMTFKLIPAYASGSKTKAMSDTNSASLYSYMNSISTGVTIGDDGSFEP